MQLQLTAGHETVEGGDTDSVVGHVSVVVVVGSVSVVVDVVVVVGGGVVVKYGPISRIGDDGASDVWSNSNSHSPGDMTPGAVFWVSAAATFSVPDPSSSILGTKKNKRRPPGSRFFSLFDL